MDRKRTRGKEEHPSSAFVRQTRVYSLKKREPRFQDLFVREYKSIEGAVARQGRVKLEQHSVSRFAKTFVSPWCRARPRKNSVLKFDVSSFFRMRDPERATFEFYELIKHLVIKHETKRTGNDCGQLNSKSVCDKWYTF